MVTSYMAVPGIPRSKPEFVVPKAKKIEIIKEFVCDFFSVPLYQIITKTRKRAPSDARHTVCYFLTWLTDMGPSEIGNELMVHHTTVIHGKEKIRDIMKIDVVFRMEMMGLKAKIENEFNIYKKGLFN